MSERLLHCWVHLITIVCSILQSNKLSQYYCNRPTCNNSETVVIIIIITKKLVLRHTMQMQTQQHTPLNIRETRNETNVSSAYSWKSTKRLSYHAYLWGGSSMQPELSNRSCGFRIFLCVHAGLVVGQKWKIEGRHVKVEQRHALCTRRGILE